MNASDKQTTPGTEANSEQAVARLLEIAGPRVEPSASLRATVREAAYAAWQRRLRRTRLNRGLGWTALAASAALVAILLRPELFPADSTGVIASIDRLDGHVDIAVDNRWHRAGLDTELKTGDRLRTAPGARAGLLLADGASLRIDEQSVIVLQSATVLGLDVGRVYLDTGPSHELPTGLTVRTGLGDIRDIGTQFEVQTDAETINVRVREGRIMLTTENARHNAIAGEVLTLSDDGEVKHAAVSTDDPSWAWVETLTPSFDTDGRSLAEFLSWVARETGRQLSFATPDTQKSAANTLLHGSIAGLAPGTALTAVMATTEFEFQLRDAEIVVHMRADNNLH